MASLTLVFTRPVNLEPTRPCREDLVKISVKEATHMGFYYTTKQAPRTMVDNLTVVQEGAVDVSYHEEHHHIYSFCH